MRQLQAAEAEAEAEDVPGVVEEDRRKAGIGDAGWDRAGDRDNERKQGWERHNKHRDVQRCEVGALQRKKCKDIEVGRRGRLIIKKIMSVPRTEIITITMIRRSKRRREK
jgi:hypothetical protein